MVRWLHISDLHIREQADWNNYSKEIIKKCKEVGKVDFVVVTGDFHNYQDNHDFQKAKIFLQNIVKVFKLDISQDLFVIPGNHDGVTVIDNKEEFILAAQHEPLDIQKRLPKLLGIFKDYENFVLELIPDYQYEHPAEVHIRTWRNKINLVHCNTAIGADGKSKDNQLLDIDGLSKLVMNNDYPTFILAHNSFFDINEVHQNRIKDFIRNNDIRAYLCGDRHIESVNQISYEDNQNRQIPCITSYKSAPDKQDNYSRFGIIIGEWEEKVAKLKGWTWVSGQGFKVDGNIHEKEISMGISESELSDETSKNKHVTKSDISGKKNVPVQKRICIGYANKKGKCNKTLPKRNIEYCNDCLNLEYYEKIVDLYRIQKYNITSNINYFFASLKSGILEVKAIVFPLYSETVNVSKEGIYKFIENINAVNNLHEFQFIHLVTNGTIGADYKKLIQQYKLEIISEDMIINKIMDFTSYLKTSINDYENNPIFNHYIDVYDVNTDDLLEYTINDFINNSYENAFLILGDYGCGKTSFLLNLLYRQAKSHLSGEDEYMPLFIPLKDYAKAIDFNNLFTNFFINKCYITNGNMEAFNFLLKYKKFIILFDGFDEVAKRVNYDVKFEIFNEICKFAVGNTKIIVTCRPNYFQEKKEYEKLIENAHLQFDPTNTNNTDFDDTYISDLNTDQVKVYIESFREELKKEGLSPTDIEYLIKNTHDLTDLSKRPFLLNIIIKTLPKIVAELKNTEEIKSLKINAATLYLKYTDLWLDRENSKGKSLIKKEDKLLFCKNLALKMFSEDRNELHFKELPKEIKSYYSDLSNIDEIDYFSHDIQSCSFLNSDGKGNFKFIHKSFMEYFVACMISDSLEKINRTNIEEINNALNVPNISTEIALFINDILNENEARKNEIIKTLEKVIDDKNISVKENIITILSKTGYNMGKIIVDGNDGKKNDYQKNDFSHSSIKDIVIRNVDFSGVTFYGAHIENVVFENCLFYHTYFQKAQLINVDFSDQTLEYSDMSYCFIKKCKFKYSLLADVQMAYAVVQNNNFNGCDMSGVNVTGTRFTNNYNFNNVIGVPYEMR